MQDSQLIKYLESVSTVSNDLKQHLREHVFVQFFSKGDRMPYLPPISNTVYFVDEGLLCGTKDGVKERTTLWFSAKGSFIVPAMLSVHKKYTERFEILIPTVLSAINIQYIINYVDVYPELKRIGMIILDQYISDLHSRELLLRMPAEERFETCYRENPQYFVDSSNNYLASYLRLSHRQFARLKRRFFRSGI